MPVRLSLFADMIKGRTWSPATLDELGGVEGIGVAFLEESFGRREANPQHRRHRTPAEAVLKALLPEHGGNLRGQVRSGTNLVNAAGYRQSPAEFADLVPVLDSELRLITPTDPEGRPVPAAGPPETGEKYYQLSHDFLVPSLRDWLTAEEKRTGGAGQGSRWPSAPPNGRPARSSDTFLPRGNGCTSLRECPRGSGRRTNAGIDANRPPAANSLHSALYFEGMLLAGWGIWEANGYIQGKRLSDNVCTADASELPAVPQERTAAVSAWAFLGSSKLPI